jgi:large subunit ribosomal protein L25
MGLVKLSVHPRKTQGKNANRRTRAAGYTPAIIYGNDREATSVQVDTHVFERILQKTGGRSVIFDLELEGESENPIALMRDVQRHPVSDLIYHVDLYEIPRGKPVEVSVAVVPEGEPEVVKFKEGEVNQLAYSVTLSCLPRDVPEQITCDISELGINDSIYVKDLVPPVGEIIDDPEMQVVVVKAVSIFVEEDEEAAEGEAVAEGDEGAPEAGEGDKEE